MDSCSRVSHHDGGSRSSHHSMTSLTLSLRSRNVSPAATALAGLTAMTVSFVDPDHRGNLDSRWWLLMWRGEISTRRVSTGETCSLTVWMVSKKRPAG